MITRTVCEPPEGATYPKVTFVADDEAGTVQIVIGGKTLEPITNDEVAALYAAMYQVVNPPETPVAT